MAKLENEKKNNSRNKKSKRRVIKTRDYKE